MIRHRASTLFLLLIAVAVLIAGCGMEEKTPQASPSGAVALLSWTPPETTADNTAIDPYEELDYYEIYVRTDENFTEQDLPSAQVEAVANLPSEDGQTFSKALVTDFDLNLLEGLPDANVLYVSLRAVGTDRQKSAFMEPVAWTRS